MKRLPPCLLALSLSVLSVPDVLAQKFPTQGPKPSAADGSITSVNAAGSPSSAIQLKALPLPSQSKTVISYGQVIPSKPVSSGTNAQPVSPTYGGPSTPGSSSASTKPIIAPTPTTSPGPSVTGEPGVGGTSTNGAASNAPVSDSNQTKVSATVEYNANSPIPDGLQLIQALNEALVKGPRAAAIRSQLPIAKAGIAQATIAPNPVFYLDQAHISEGVYRRGAVLTVDPPWKLLFRVLAATRLYTQTKLDLLAQVWQLRADTRRAYTESVLAQETERTLSQLYDLTNRLLEVSSKRFQAGDVPELDVLRARLASSQAAVDLGVGRQRVVRAKQQLNVMLGRAVEQGVGIPRLPEFVGGTRRVINPKAIRHGILPDFSRTIPPLNYFLDLGYTNRLELKSLDQQQLVNNMNVKNSIASIVPNPNIAGGLSTESNPPSGPKLSGPFLTLNIESPVTNFNQGDVAKYRAMRRQLTYQRGAQKNIVTSDISSAYNNLIAARGKIREYQEHVLDDSNEVARLSRRSYEVGQSDINSTLLAQQANIQVQMQYLDAVMTYQSAYTDLEQACGTPLE